MGHKRDWKQYNKHLVNRCKINLWVSPKLLRSWRAKKCKKNGRPFVYSDELIKTICYLRFKFRISLREVEGLFGSFVSAMRRSLRIPCYTQVCRRMKKLDLPSEFLTKQGVTDIVLDTTGLKVYGEGEWRAEKYGGKKRWKKLHLATDMKTGKLVFSEITDEHVHDTACLENALKRMNGRKGKVLFDGIADSLKCYRLAGKYNKQLLTPPKKGAVLRSETELIERNDAVRMIRGLGNDKTAKSIWGKLVGYNQRVIIESKISQWKRLYGGELKSGCPERKKKEVQLKTMMINAMIDAQAV
ncbi:MAG: hypothetical protein RL235_576 [Chlamydiota bacterium]